MEVLITYNVHGNDHDGYCTDTEPDDCHNVDQQKHITIFLEPIDDINMNTKKLTYRCNALLPFDFFWNTCTTKGSKHCPTHGQFYKAQSLEVIRVVPAEEMRIYHEDYANRRNRYDYYNAVFKPSFRYNSTVVWYVKGTTFYR